MTEPSSSSKTATAKQPVERIIPIKVETERPVRTTRSRDKLVGGLQKAAVAVDEKQQKQSSEEDDSVINESPTVEDTSKERENELVVEIPERTVMPCNQPEKIVLVVDTALDEHCSEFQMQDGEMCSPLIMLKRGLEMFLLNKYAIDSRHQYAVIVLNENEALWMLDFTSDVNKVLKVLHTLEPCNAEDIFNLNSVFDVINEHVRLEPVRGDLMIPPAYIVRAILFYSRSYTIPQMTRDEEVDGLLSSPYFTFDVLMTHEPPNTDNNCAKISKALQNIDSKGFAYFFSVARNTFDLYVAMAKLLSHPLQRPVQRVAKYNLV